MKNVRVNFEGWIQLLGMVGVLGGLVFVGLEMRQSQLRDNSRREQTCTLIDI